MGTVYRYYVPMSTVTRVEDSLLSILDDVESVRDPVQRLVEAKRIEQTFKRMMRKLKQEAAYEARQSHTAADIAHAIGNDRKMVDYLVRKHLENHPYLERPRRQVAKRES